MKIDPTGRVPNLPAQPTASTAKRAGTSSPGDQIDIAGRPTAEATYSRVPASDRASQDSTLEVQMAQDARAQKLAEIRSRMEAGVYNSRDMIERVVDRLLDKWDLGPSGKRNTTV